MKAFKTACAGVIAAALACAAVTAQAATVELNAVTRGCVIQTGVYGCGGAGTADGNVYTGHDGDDYRSFFVFDLSGVTGAITSATFTMQLDPTYGYYSPDASESVAFHALGDDSILKLLANTPDAAVYAALASGADLGGPTLTDADKGTTIDLSLGALWLAALNDAIGGNFGIGGTLASFSGQTSIAEAVFGWSLEQTFKLTLNYDDTSVVPLPAALPLFLAGLGGLGLTGRKRRAR